LNIRQRDSLITLPSRTTLPGAPAKAGCAVRERATERHIRLHLNNYFSSPLSSTHNAPVLKFRSRVCFPSSTVLWRRWRSVCVGRSLPARRGGRTTREPLNALRAPPILIVAEAARPGQRARVAVRLAVREQRRQLRTARSVALAPTEGVATRTWRDASRRARSVRLRARRASRAHAGRAGCSRTLLAQHAVGRATVRVALEGTRRACELAAQHVRAQVGRVDAHVGEARARQAQRRTVQLSEAVPLESKADDGDCAHAEREGRGRSRVSAAGAGASVQRAAHAPRDG
jgi:hypothetical protein